MSFVSIIVLVLLPFVWFFRKDKNTNLIHKIWAEEDYSKVVYDELYDYDMQADMEKRLFDDHVQCLVRVNSSKSRKPISVLEDIAAHRECFLSQAVEEFHEVLKEIGVPDNTGLYPEGCYVGNQRLLMVVLLAKQGKVHSSAGTCDTGPLAMTTGKSGDYSSEFLVRDFHANPLDMHKFYRWYSDTIREKSGGKYFICRYKAKDKNRIGTYKYVYLWNFSAGARSGKYKDERPIHTLTDAELGYVGMLKWQNVSRWF